MRNLATALDALDFGPVPAPFDTLTFLITEDGETRTETISLDFSDIPPEEMTRIVYESDTTKIDDVAAGVLAYRLDVPKDAAAVLLRQMRQGGGVVDGG